MKDTPPETYIPDQRLLLRYAALVGITLLIPIPLLDDLVANHFRRRLVHELAQRSAIGEFTPQEANIVVSGRPDLVKKGCLAVLIYPINKILLKWIKALIREVLFFLEIRRAILAISYTYYFGYLVGFIFHEELYYQRGPDQAYQIHLAIQKTLKTANTGFFRQVVKSSFSSSKQVFLAGGRGLTRLLKSVTRDVRKTLRRNKQWRKAVWQRLKFWKRRKAPLESPTAPEETFIPEVETQLDSVLEDEEIAEIEEIRTIVDILQDGLQEIPDEHFRALEAQVREYLIVHELWRLLEDR